MDSTRCKGPGNQRDLFACVAHGCSASSVVPTLSRQLDPQPELQVQGSRGVDWSAFHKPCATVNFRSTFVRRSAFHRRTTDDMGNVCCKGQSPSHPIRIDEAPLDKALNPMPGGGGTTPADPAPQGARSLPLRKNHTAAKVGGALAAGAVVSGLPRSGAARPACSAAKRCVSPRRSNRRTAARARMQTARPSSSGGGSARSSATTTLPRRCGRGSRLAPDPYAKPGPQGGDAGGKPRIPWICFTLLPNQQHQARPPHLPGEWLRRVTISSKLWPMRERVCTSVNPNRARCCSCPCGTRSSTSGGATRWTTPSAYNGHMLSPRKGSPCQTFAAMDKVVCSRNVGKDPNMGLMKATGADSGAAYDPVAARKTMLARPNPTARPVLRQTWLAGLKPSLMPWASRIMPRDGGTPVSALLRPHRPEGAARRRS